MDEQTRKALELAMDAICELRYSNTTHAADTICDKATAAIDAALSAHAAPVAPGEPVRPAPYDPTPAMLDAARRIDPALRLEDIRALWAAMWTAAPAAPVAREPSRDQCDQILKGIGAAVTDSNREYLRVWLRDWFAHGIGQGGAA